MRQRNLIKLTVIRTPRYNKLTASETMIRQKEEGCFFLFQDLVVRFVPALCQELGWRMRLFSFFFKFSSMIEHCFHDKLSFAILIHLSTCPFSSRDVDSIIKGRGKQVSSFAAFKNDPNLSLRLIPYFFVFPLFLFFFFFFFFCGPRSLG